MKYNIHVYSSKIKQHACSDAIRGLFIKYLTTELKVIEYIAI